MTQRRQFTDCDDLSRHIVEIGGDTCVLSFSCGKDAVGAWLHLRRYFKRIVPFYLYTVPGLEFVDESLRYYESFFETPIARLPHPSLFRQLRNGVFQTPERFAAIQAANLPRLSYPAIDQHVRQRFACPGAFIAIGSRAADSTMRNASIRRNGPVNWGRRSFFPIFDWKIDRLVDEIEAARVKLAVDYRLFGSSFDGIDYRYLRPLKEHLPRDYQRVLEWFPLAEVEMLRRQYAEAPHAA